MHIIAFLACLAHASHLCDKFGQVALLGEASVEGIPGGSLAHSGARTEGTWTVFGDKSVDCSGAKTATI